MNGKISRDDEDWVHRDAMTNWEYWVAYKRAELLRLQPRDGSATMNQERGSFKVMIACCARGNCSRCLADGNKTRRKWWGISDKLSEASAHQVAKSWRNFDAYVEPMDEEDHARAAAAEEFFARNKPPMP